MTNQNIDGGKAFDWGREHVKLLAEIAPDEFDILHYGAIAELKAIK